MLIKEYLKELAECRLCEHQCGINRLEQERGVCGITTPVVASATLHPAPPESYTVFLAGCNFKCLNCQNWIISQYPDNAYQRRIGWCIPPAGQAAGEPDRRRASVIWSCAHDDIDTAKVCSGSSGGIHQREECNSHRTNLYGASE